VRRLALVLLSVFFAAGLASQVEAQTRPYSQTVDNATKGRFSAPSAWGTSSYSTDRFGPNYKFAEPARVNQPAQFKVKIPKTADYAVYARWPANKGYNSATRIGVQTTSGLKWKTVNQRTNGGKWVKLGTYRMKAGDANYVRIARHSTQKGLIIADAVRVVQVGGGSTSTSSGTSGADVVREARRYIGTPYRLGGPEDCKPFQAMDCSCLTMTVFKKFGLNTPDNPQTLWNSYGRRVSSAAPGDIVFFSEDGSGRITHVGIYSGNGNLVHASNYWGETVEKEMKYIRGYMGAKRMVN
jgi:cell wall-associated NlpC family hydrolase